MFATLEDLRIAAGCRLGPTPWRLVDQALIDRFAEVTGDRQWIHVDPTMAATRGSFGGTVAHGMLTLSLSATFLTELLIVDNARLVVNCGFNRVRFLAPVRSGSRVRGNAEVVAATEVTDGVQVTAVVNVEIKDRAARACTAEHIFRFFC